VLSFLALGFDFRWKSQCLESGVYLVVKLFDQLLGVTQLFFLSVQLANDFVDDFRALTLAANIDAET
jgi:hypothetical protein